MKKAFNKMGTLVLTGSLLCSYIPFNYQSIYAQAINNEGLSSNTSLITGTEMQSNSNSHGDNLVVGGINVNTGQDFTTKDRARTEMYSISKNTVSVSIGSVPAQYGVCFYDNNGAYISWTGWTASNTYDIPDNAAYFRIVMRYTNNRTIGETELSELMSCVSMITKEDILNVGGINVNTGQDFTTKDRARTEMYTISKNTVSVNIGAVPAQYGVYFYDNNGAYISWTGWTANISYNTPNNAAYFRLVMRFTNNRTITEEGLSELENCITVNNNIAPLNLASPESTTITSSQSATFTVSSDSNITSYAWEYKLPNSNNWLAYTGTGANTASITVAGSEATSGTQYRCTVTDNYGQTAISTPAFLTIESTSYSAHLVVGGINVNTGQDFTTKDRARTEMYSISKNTVSVSIGSVPAQYGVCFYDNNGAYISWTGWTASNTYDIPDNAAYFRIVMRYTNNRTIGETELSELMSCVSMITKEDILNVGGINVNTGQDFTTKDRARTEMYTISKNTVSVNIGAVPAQYGVYFYDNNGAYISWTGWTANISYNTPNNAAYFRLVMRFTNNRTITEEGLSELENCITVNNNIAPLNLASPESTTITSSQSATFTVSSDSNITSYAWEYKLPNSNNWLAYTGTGANTASITVAGSEAATGTQYRCTVTDNFGQTKTSDAATLTIRTPMSVSDLPSTTVVEGKNVSFSITATGENLTYQWQTGVVTDDGTPIDWTNIEGATSSTYTFKTKYTDDGRLYRCIVTDAYESINSSVATLTVTPAYTVISNTTKEISMNFGDACQLDATGTGLRYYSNTKALTVDKNGLVTANDTCTGYVFVLDRYGHKTYYKIHVVDAFEALAFDEPVITVNPDESIRLYTNKTSHFIISDEIKSSVWHDYYDNYYGEWIDFTGFIPGSYSVLAYTDDGEIATCDVNVEGDVTDAALNTSYTGTLIIDPSNYNELDEQAAANKWYRYVNDTDTEVMVTFDVIETEGDNDTANAGYAVYYKDYFHKN
ncbi:hypothetical protein [Ruminococcus flavefaciens]|uniref:hypothetical protein n=1 Tax=Ruminococcus flavefaciens TaxID=1265 RepID=UPI0026ED46E1|nr:hypothetical protein [Ruminococcus flavefaciens]